MRFGFIHAVLICLLLGFSIHVANADDTWTLYTSENSDLSYNEVYNIAIDKNNIKWVMSKLDAKSTEDLQIFDDQTWTRPILPGAEYFRSIAFDSENNIWIGTITELLKVDNNSMELLERYQAFDLFGFLTNNIVDMVIDNSGLLWLTLPGVYSESIPQVCTFDGDSVKTVLKNRYVYGLACDSYNTVWGAAWFFIDNANLYQFDGSDINYYSIDQDLVDSEPSFTSNIIAIDHNDTKWLNIGGGGTWIGLTSFKDGVWTLYTPDNSPLPGKRVMDIIVDHNNIKWIGTDAGLTRFDGNNWEIFTTENSGLVNDYVLSLAVEEDNTLWIGTNGGLLKYTGETITAVDEEPTPKALSTVTSYPNPFNPSTTISFTLPESGHAKLTVYNLAGQKVRTLADESMAAGNHTVVWDGRDDTGNAVAAGVYLTRLNAGGTVATGKMVLVK